MNLHRNEFNQLSSFIGFNILESDNITESFTQLSHDILHIDNESILSPQKWLKSLKVPEETPLSNKHSLDTNSSSVFSTGYLI